MLNVELIREVQKIITEEPRRFDMGVWATHFGPELIREHNPPCGTVGCIAGWAVMAKLRKEEPNIEPGELATVAFARMGDLPREYTAEILGLDPYQGQALFSEGLWPQPYRRDYDAAPTQAEAVAVAVKLLDAVIESNGEVLNG